MTRTRRRRLQHQSARSSPSPSAQPNVDRSGPAVDDRAAFIRTEVARSIGLVAEHAGVLEGLGRRAFGQTSELTTDATAAALVDAAHRIRSLVLHALSVLADLQYQAGRLDCLAALRRESGNEE